jgi:hypothetical protein
MRSSLCNFDRRANYFGPSSRLRVGLRHRRREAGSLRPAHCRMPLCSMALVALLALPGTTPTWAQAGPSVEYQVKAAFLFIHDCCGEILHSADLHAGACRRNGYGSWCWWRLRRRAITAAAANKAEKAQCQHCSGKESRRFLGSHGCLLLVDLAGLRRGLVSRRRKPSTGENTGSDYCAFEKKRRPAS